MATVIIYSRIAFRGKVLIPAVMGGSDAAQSDEEAGEKNLFLYLIYRIITVKHFPFYYKQL